MNNISREQELYEYHSDDSEEHCYDKIERVSIKEYRNGVEAAWTDVIGYIEANTSTTREQILAYCKKALHG